MTFIEEVNGITVTVHIPDRTPEEQEIRDKEIKESLLSIYRKLEAEGEAHILFKNESL